VREVVASGAFGRLASYRRRARKLAELAVYLASGRVRRLPTALVTNEFGFSFGDDGWNYVRALVAEIDADPNRPLEETTFFRFFKHPDVREVRYLNDLLFLHDPARRARQEFGFYLGTYPWGDHVGGGPWGRHFDEVEGEQTRDLYGYRSNPWYEPGDEQALRLEEAATANMLRSIRAGYRPWRHRRLPEATLLVCRDGTWRAMRYDGQHRIAVLAHLGHRHLTALVPSVRTMNAAVDEWQTASRLPKAVTRGEIVVREEEVDEWRYVREGLCSRDQALEIFHAFFELDGRERIESLGLPPIY
jgi:hypothetical protein